MQRAKNQKTFLYRHYDVDRLLLYIGISSSSTGRTSNHLRSATWSERIAIIRVEPFNSRRTAAQEENAAIQKEKPLYNNVRRVNVSAFKAYALVKKNAKNLGLSILKYCAKKKLNYASVMGWKYRSGQYSIPINIFSKITP